MRDAIPVCGSVDCCNCALAHDAVDRVGVIGPQEYGDALFERDMRWVGRLGDSRRGAPMQGSRGVRGVGAGSTLYYTAVGLA